MDRIDTAASLQLNHGVTPDTAQLMIRAAAQLGHSAPVNGIRVIHVDSTDTYAIIGADEPVAELP